MPHKLGFHIAQVTSEGEGGVARELLHPGPGTRGWVSAPWCIFPQQITLQLHERAHLATVQILAHHSYIPEKIELHIGDVPPSKDVCLQHAKFSLLGHISLSDNHQTNFRARELKSISLECTGAFLRLILHKNHVNKLNLYNQIGVVGVNILGNEVEANNNSVSPDGEGGQVPGGRGGEAPPHHDLVFAMYVDTRVAATISQLEERRAVAVREERYSYADRLKAAVTQLRSAGERLGKYEIEKRHAIESENYDRAKVKKEQAEEYREEVYKALSIDDLLERKGKLDKNDLPGGSTLPDLPPPPRPKNPAPPRPSTPSENSTGSSSTTTTPPSAPSFLPPARHPNTPPKPPPSPPRSPSPPPLRTPPTPLPDLRQGGHLTAAAVPLTPRPPPSAPPTQQPPPIHTSYTSYDERTLPALKHRDVLERVAAEEAGAGRRQVNLSDQDKKDAALPLDVFGRELVEKIYSKNYSEKEAGLRQLQEQLTNYTPEAGVRPDRYVRAAVVLVRRALRDKVYSVGLLASNTLSHILSHFVSKHKVAKKEVGATVDKVLPELLVKTADNATRTQQLAVQAILTLLDFSLERGVGSVGGEVTRPLTSGVHPRAALCRATIVQSHLAAHGVSSLPRDKESGFTPKHLVEFAHSAFRHQNSDVRKVGEQLLLSLYAHFPGPVRKTLPTTDDPARKTVLYRNFFEQLEMVDQKRESAPPPRGQQTRTSPPLASTTSTAAPPPQSTSTTPPHHYHTRASSSSSSDREDPGGRIGEERGGRAGGRDEEESRVGGRRREREDFRERREGSEVARIRREEGRRGSREDSRESSLVREWRGVDDRGVSSEREPVSERRKGGHSRGDRETGSLERAASIPREVNGTRDLRHRDVREEVWQDEGSREVWAGSEADMGCGAVPQISITPDESEVRGRALSRLNGALPSAPPSPGDPEDKTCIFCGEYDPGFSEAGLDVHYWRSCPLLTRCHHCRQVVEVASLTNHLLVECSSSNEFRRCDRCSEAIPKSAFSTHTLAKTCTPCQPEVLANHCPLCHDNISPWDQGWRSHLLPGPHACPANPRARPQGSKGGTTREKSPERKGGSGGSGGGAGGVREGSKPRLSSSSGTPGTPRRNVSRRR